MPPQMIAVYLYSSSEDEAGPSRQMNEGGGGAGVACRGCS